MGVKERELYNKFVDYLKSDCGYKDILECGDPHAFEDLMNFGTVAGSNGKRIPGNEKRDIREREWDIAQMLLSGEPMYIYKNGETYPTKVTFDPEKGEFTAEKEPVNKTPDPEPVKKPGLFWRILNIIPAMYGGSLPSVKKWKNYQKELEAIDNIFDERRIERREAYYKHEQQQITKYDKKHLEEERINKLRAEKKAKAAEKNVVKGPEVKAATKKEPEAPQKTEPQAEEKQPKEKSLEEQLKEITDQQTAIRLQQKELASKQKDLQNQQLSLERLILEKNGKLRNENQVDLVFGKEKKAPVKPASTLETIKEVPDYLEEDMASIQEVDEELEEEEEFEIEENQEANELEAEDKKKDIVDLDSSNNGSGNNGADGQPEAKKDAPKSPIDILLENLEADGTQLTGTQLGNLWQLYTDAQVGGELLQDAIKNPNLEKIAGGDAVKAMVAFQNIKTELASGSKQQVLNALDKEGAAKQFQQLTKVSKDVTYASDYAHDKSFFEKNFLNPDGLNKMSESVTKSANAIIDREKLFGIKTKDPLYKSAVEAEKMAQKSDITLGKSKNIPKPQQKVEPQGKVVKKDDEQPQNAPAQMGGPGLF